MKEYSSKKEYNQIVKNTIVLGSSQIVQMGVTFIRAKMIAVLLGPSGMGTNSLILSALMVMQQIASLGIYQSGVRELAVFYHTGEEEKITRIRHVFLCLSTACGVIGVLIMGGLSPVLSKTLFDNQEYTKYFLAVSGAILFMALYNGYATILQATHHLVFLSKATITGALGNLIVAGCSFYFLRMEGIVPAIVGGYIAFWISFRYYEHKIVFPKVEKITPKEFIQQSKGIIKLGVVLMVSSLMIVLFTFLLNVCISKWGSIEEVGLYQSAASIIMQGMLISNMILASDFFPRLSAVYADNRKMNTLINQQLSLLTYIIAPISALIIVFAPFIVTLLLSPDFIVVVKLIQIMSIALIYKAVWMVFSYTILAKGDKKTYFIFDAFLGNGVNFFICIGGFYWQGIEGIAIAYVVSSVFIAILMQVTVKLKYGLKMTANTYRILWGIGGIMLVLATIKLFLDHWSGLLISYLLCSMICFWAIRQLYKKTDIWVIIMQKIRK